jgi:hypothetical protein
MRNETIAGRDDILARGFTAAMQPIHRATRLTWAKSVKTRNIFWMPLLPLEAQMKAVTGCRGNVFEKFVLAEGVGQIRLAKHLDEGDFVEAMADRLVMVVAVQLDMITVGVDVAR